MKVTCFNWYLKITKYFSPNYFILESNCDGTWSGIPLSFHKTSKPGVTKTFTLLDIWLKTERDSALNAENSQFFGKTDKIGKPLARTCGVPGSSWGAAARAARTRGLARSRTFGRGRLRRGRPDTEAGECSRLLRPHTHKEIYKRIQTRECLQIQLWNRPW